MRSIDLFTGIGGFTLALQDIASPVMYCDYNANVRLELQSIMSSLRCANIHKDYPPEWAENNTQKTHIFFICSVNA